MLRAKRVRLRRTHHAQMAIELLREERGTEIVISHVRGENNGALRGCEFSQISFAFEFVSERGLLQPINGRVGQRPTKIRESPKDSRVIYQPRSTRKNNAQMNMHSSA